MGSARWPSVHRPAPLPTIDAGDPYLPRVTAAAWQALARANARAPRLFSTGSALIRLERDPTGTPLLCPLTVDRLRHALARAAHWYRIGTDGRARPAAPPLAVVRDALAVPADEVPLPLLRRVVEVPIVGPSGIQTQPGYDAATHTVLAPHPALSLPALPPQPTREEGERARRWLVEELLGDFPFVGAADRAHAMALLLVPFLREVIAGPVPLHVLDKPTPGTGATRLVDVLTTLASGRPAAKLTEAATEEEWRKRLTGKLREGPTFCVIDNVRRRLEAAALAAALTADTVEDRLLGQSRTVRLAVRCIWVVTANNVELSTEIARRTVRIRLDAAVERPWLRAGFRHPDLLRWTQEQRGELVGAALVLAQRWIAAGRPGGRRTLGMFERWAEVLGGVLEVAGVPGFLDNVAEVYEVADPERAACEAFVARWWETHAQAAVGVRELYAVALEADLDLGSGAAPSRKARLARRLRALRDRRFGHLCVRGVGGRRFQLEAVPCAHCGGTAWREPLDAQCGCACAAVALPPG